MCVLQYVYESEMANNNICLLHASVFGLHAKLNRNYTMCSDRAKRKLNTSHLHTRSNRKKNCHVPIRFFPVRTLRLSLCRSSQFSCCNSFCRHYTVWIKNANSCKLHSTNPCIWFSLRIPSPPVHSSCACQHACAISFETLGRIRFDLLFHAHI